MLINGLHTDTTDTYTQVEHKLQQKRLFLVFKTSSPALYKQAINKCPLMHSYISIKIFALRKIHPLFVQ